MQALHVFIDSLRSAKRFVNVSRLVRASHVEPLVGPPDAREGAGGENDAHRQVLFLLGMLTGYPGLTIAIFRELLRTPTAGQSRESFRTTLSPGGRAPAHSGSNHSSQP